MPSANRATRRFLSPGGEAVEDAKKSNDVAFTSVSLLPVTVSLPLSSPPDPAVRDVVLSTLSAYGSAALASSTAFGGRFDSLDLGPYDEVPAVASSKRLRSRPGSRALSDVTALPVGGTVYLSGAYWEDDPTPDEVTGTFVEGVSTDEAREALAAGLRPLVCGGVPDCEVDGEGIGVYLTDDSAGSPTADAADVPDAPAADDGGDAPSVPLDVPADVPRRGRGPRWGTRP